MHIINYLRYSRCSNTWFIVGAIALLLVLHASTTTYAQSGYPQRIDPEINAFANILSPADATTVRAMLQKLRRDTRREMVVVSIDSIYSYSTSDQTIESFATNLFNTW